MTDLMLRLSDLTYRHRQWLRITWWRMTNPIQRHVGVCTITNGTDCDGMRWSNCDWHWTRYSAHTALIDGDLYADGPWYGSVYSAKDGREFEANYLRDTRDRYAERAGF